MDFKQAEERYIALKSQFAQGTLNETDFKAQLEELMIQDDQGDWWMIGYESGQWYRNDGNDWVLAEPPGHTSKLSGQRGVVEPTAKAQAEPERKTEDAELVAAATLGPQIEEKGMGKTQPPVPTVAPQRKPVSKVMMFGITGVVVLAIIGIAVSAMSGNRNAPASAAVNEAPAATQKPAFTATRRPAPTATQAPATEAPAATEAPDSIFYDDFSNPDSGWPVDEFRDYEEAGGDGYYFLFAGEDHYSLSSPNLAFSDFGPDLAVEVVVFSANESALAGVYCRANQDGAYYLFQVAYGPSVVQIWYNDGSSWAMLAEASVNISDSNYITGICNGDSLDLIWNGEHAVGVIDDRLPDAGEVGLYVESSASGFDNFYVYYP